MSGMSLEDCCPAISVPSLMMTLSHTLSPLILTESRTTSSPPFEARKLVLRTTQLSLISIVE